MKQVVLCGGAVSVVDVPAPQVGAREILVRVRHSCLSIGTEIAGVRLAAEPLYRRALRQPDNLRRAIEMAQVHGWRHTLARARGETQARPLGYSAAGVIVQVGAEVELFAPGDCVACAGAGVANHAELISVPVNLAVKVPAGVDSDSAATVALGAIALQGVRRCSPQFGETIVVVGLGLLGQLTVQLLRASGCRVVAVDPDARRTEMARTGGADAVLAPDEYAPAVARTTGGVGADAVIVTAASTNDEVVNTAVRACRRKGRVVVVGDVALGVDRGEMYARELDLLIATSYGPGRYDPAYEFDGVDYPLPYVRWTENRNMQAYLDALAQGQVRLDHLSRLESGIEEAVSLYESLQSAQDKPLLALLKYPDAPAGAARKVITASSAPAPRGALRVALVGGGSFAQSTHLPNLARLPNDYVIHAVMSRTGATARVIAERAGARYATTDFDAIVADPDVDVVLIATRHDLHAALAQAALAAGKHVLLEKPLATSRAQLEAIVRFFEGRSTPVLMTGFNRRFSPALVAARAALVRRSSPLLINYRVNAGFLPLEHWVHGPEGGGRNIGEACHIYDVFAFLTGSRPLVVQADAISPRGRELRRNDNFVACIRYEDGSVCTLTYTAIGASDYPKERMEIFVDGAVVSLDDYRALEIKGAKARGWSGSTADKGHFAELVAFAAGVRAGRWPITLQEQIDATRVSFDVEDALHSAGAASE